MVNSKILFGNIILILVILFTFYFIRTNIKISKESFFVNQDENIPSETNNCKNIIMPSEEGQSTNTFEDVDDVNPKDYKKENIDICKYIAYENNSTPYSQKINMKSYDAYKLCMNDPKCNSFSFNGRDPEATSDVKFYRSNSNITENTNNWASSNYPNLYIKRRGNCLLDKTISYMNPLITPQYSNDFLYDYRDVLNNQ